MTLEEARANVGRRVLYMAAYSPRGGDGSTQILAGEEGIITRVNDNYVFVRYGREWQSKATAPEDLTLLREEARR